MTRPQTTFLTKAQNTPLVHQGTLSVVNISIFGCFHGCLEFSNFQLIFLLHLAVCSWAQIKCYRNRNKICSGMSHSINRTLWSWFLILYWYIKLPTSLFYAIPYYLCTDCCYLMDPFLLHLAKINQLKV